MRRHNQIQFVCLLLMLLILVSTATANVRRPRSISNGTWGGDHVRLEVSDRSAAIEYDCANGTILGPLKVNSSGRFNFRGTHSREHGGPIRSDEAAKSEPARYRGWTDGKTMTLTVTLANTKQKIGTFKLSRGNQGRVWKCK